VYKLFKNDGVYELKYNHLTNLSWDLNGKCIVNYINQATSIYDEEILQYIFEKVIKGKTLKRKKNGNIFTVLDLNNIVDITNAIMIFIDTDTGEGYMLASNIVDFYENYEYMQGPNNDKCIVEKLGHGLMCISYKDLIVVSWNQQGEIVTKCDLSLQTIETKEKHKCHCDIKDLATYGCKCGGI